MSLPNSYTQKPSAIPAYFDAILNAEAPDRFTSKFLANLEFKSTNDRTFIAILKELGFLDADGVPQQRYFEFHDRTQSEKILAQAVREAYSDLFNVNKDANRLSADEVNNKLRTLYTGSKKNEVVRKIANQFVALCAYADFSGPTKQTIEKQEVKPSESKVEQKETIKERASVSLGGLQYHINIVLPESRDQAVYDAIFKSLKDHLG